MSPRHAALQVLIGLIFTNYKGIVVSFAVSAAVYSSLRHFMTDKTIRLKRQNRAADAHHDAHHGAHEESHQEGEKA